MSRDSDIVDYLLGELPPDERARVERRMREEDDFRREVERLRPLVADLEALPPEAWQPAEVPPLPPLPPRAQAAPAAPARRRRMALGPVAALAACLVLIAAGIGIGALVFGGDDGGGGAGPQIALQPIGEAGPRATGEARLVSGDDGGLRLQVTGLDPSAPDGYYGLWLLDDAEHMVSLGSFRVPRSGAATVTVPLPTDLTDFRYIDVSVEREDGDPGHSGRSVLRAPTSA